MEAERLTVEPEAEFGLYVLPEVLAVTRPEPEVVRFAVPAVTLLADESDDVTGREDELLFEAVILELEEPVFLLTLLLVTPIPSECLVRGSV